MGKYAMTYTEAMQKCADKYFEEHPLATTSDLAVWAITSGFWEPPSDLVLRRCKQDFARALREQHIIDDKGNSIRAKHAARIVSGEKQMTFWGDIRKAPTEHIIIAFQQRREQIVGDCRQLDRDIEYFNKTRSEPGKEFQMVFDFRDDIEEGKFSTDFLA
ncbi:hypothetical protein [Schlesneria sp.]|uniref:hypothetical protein n=1 Tax=Schlesneria sp. TaxID=2762018 RepID=UPI002F18E9E6